MQRGTLKISRRLGETVLIGQGQAVVEIEVERLGNGRVQFVIDAPVHIPVARGELDRAERQLGSTGFVPWRSHNEAVALVGERATAAAGFDMEEDEDHSRYVGDPEVIARALLSDLLPTEEVSNVLQGIAASALNLQEAFDRLGDDESLSPDERVMGKQGTGFVAVAQEIAYALLMAGVDR